MNTSRHAPGLTAGGFAMETYQSVALDAAQWHGQELGRLFLFLAMLLMGLVIGKR